MAAVSPESRSRLTRFAAQDRGASSSVNRAHSFESLAVSRTGGLLIVGWIDDIGAPLDAVKVVARDWSLTFDGAMLARVRRTDVEEALGTPARHGYGYFGFIDAGEPIDPAGGCKVEVYAGSGLAATYECAPRLMEDADLRDLILSYLATVQHFGNQQVGAVACADGGLGAELITFNRRIVRQVTASPYVARFGPKRRAHRGSIIVSLAETLDPIFMQNALFSGGPGIEDYEFIYVCHTPELAEQALAEARIAARLYDIGQSVVVLSGNAGIGGGANAAAGLARSDQLLVISPNVFPRDRDWAQKHTRILDELPKAQTQLFGAQLFFDDGSLAGSGLYYEIDRGPIGRSGEIAEFHLARVEHSGKGAPAGAARFLTPRPVPGITGAFMSCDRRWFEQLDGFTDAYMCGDYQDADLCLKSIAAGKAPWIHDLNLWHLEGQGVPRGASYQGGSIVNRWLFSADWGASILENLGGQTPGHPAFQPQPAPQQAKAHLLPAHRSSQRSDIASLVA